MLVSDLRRGKSRWICDPRLLRAFTKPRRAIAAQSPAAAILANAGIAVADFLQVNFVPVNSAEVAGLPEGL